MSENYFFQLSHYLKSQVFLGKSKLKFEFLDKNEDFE